MMDLPPNPSPPTPANAAEPAQQSASHDRWAHRRGEPRVFAFLWTVFLFAATAATFLSAFAAGAASPDVMRPATRALVAVALAGIAIIWPMIRLSQAADRHPVSGCVQDLIVVLIPAQAVIWPQWFGWLGRWPFSVISAISVLCCAWAFLVGGLLAVAQLSHYAAEVRAGADHPARWPAWRWMCLFLIAALAGLAPASLRISPGSVAADATQESFRASWMFSPISAVYELTRDRAWTGTSAAVVRQHWVALAMTGAAALPLWLVALIRSRSIQADGGLH